MARLSEEIFASHALEHEIGGLFDVAHGAGLAAIWGSWARYVYKDCLPRFEKFAMNVMRVDPEGTADDVALRGIEAIEASSVNSRCQLLSMNLALILQMKN